MGPKVSVIIPVYNTGPYLKRCIDTIISQTLQDIEIIIIDDGSEQTTADLCDQLAASDSRIRVLHKKNEGVSAARNVGLAMALGKYVGFVDSDDWIAPDMYNALFSTAEKESCDIIMCDALTIQDGKKETVDTFTHLKQSSWLSKNDISSDVLCEIAGSTWRALYRRSFIEANSISFPVGLKLSEDRIFNITALGKSTGFYYLKHPFYYRYVRKGSAAYSYHSDAADIITRAHAIIEQNLKRLWNETSYFQVFKRQELALFYGAMNAIYLYDNGLTAHERYKKLKDLCNNVEFRDVLAATGASDIRAIMVRNNLTVLLYIATSILQIKHRLFD